MRRGRRFPGRGVRILGILLILAAPGLPGCTSGGASDVGAGDADVAGDVPAADGIPDALLETDTAPDASDAAKCPPTLEYADGPDIPGEPGVLLAVWSGERNLRTRVGACGIPQDGVAVTYELVDNPDGLCELGATVAYTGQDGVAGAKVHANDTGWEGECRVKACVADETCVEFTVRVECKCVIPPKLAGTWDLSTTVDLVSGAPPAVQTVLNFLVDLVVNPAPGLLRLMCDPAIAPESSLPALCAECFEDPAYPSMDTLTPTGQAVRSMLDSRLASIPAFECPVPRVDGACPVIYTFGDPLPDVFRKAGLRSTMTCTKEPGTDGDVAAGGCREEWRALALAGFPASVCFAGPGGCPGRDVPLTDLPGIAALPTADLAVRVDPAWTLAIAPHDLALGYGALLQFLAEKHLLPSIFGDGTGGQPPVDSLEVYLASMLGGWGCTADSSCCDRFAESLAGLGSGLSPNLSEGACDALVVEGSTYVRGFLAGLDAPPARLTIGTPAGAPCALHDTDRDMTFDALGGPAAADSCAWDLRFTAGGYEYAVEARFHGARQ